MKTSGEFLDRGKASYKGYGNKKEDTQQRKDRAD